MLLFRIAKQNIKLFFRNAGCKEFSGKTLNSPDRVTTAKADILSVEERHDENANNATNLNKAGYYVGFVGRYRICNFREN